MNSAGLVTASYIAATILFILALGGLSNQETARRGNWYGIIGMTLALVATILGVVTQHYTLLIIMLLIGGSIGLVLARRVQMTQMPELVATCIAWWGWLPYWLATRTSWITQPC